MTRSFIKLNSMLKKKPVIKQDTNKLTKEVIRLLQLEGFTVWRNNNAGVYDKSFGGFRKNSAVKGISDIVGYQRKTGRALYCEIKTGSDKLSPEQRTFLCEAIDNGCIAFECRSIDDVLKQIKKIKG